MQGSAGIWASCISGTGHLQAGTNLSIAGPEPVWQTHDNVIDIEAGTFPEDVVIRMTCEYVCRFIAPTAPQHCVSKCLHLSGARRISNVSDSLLTAMRYAGDNGAIAAPENPYGELEHLDVDLSAFPDCKFFRVEV